MKWGENLSDWKTKRKTTIGGQAVIEGVMMRGPEDIAIAVRKPDSQIVVETRKSKSYTKRYKILGLPLIRGIVAFIESLVIGVNMISYSAQFYEDDEEETQAGWFENLLNKVFKDKLDTAIMVFSVILSLGLAVILFFWLPSYLIGLIKSLNGDAILNNIIEGVIRILFLIIYILIISMMKDIKRVFQYHGAEHKTIYCYENQEELSVENARKYSTLHPRCGTNFLLIVMVVSVFVFAFLGWPDLLTRTLSRVLLLPVVAGVSYEILKFIGKSDSKVVHMLTYPGLILQKLTTAEPDDSQLEVAIAALKGVLVEDREADAW